MYNRKAMTKRKKEKKLKISPKVKEALEWVYCIVIAVILA